MSIKKTIIIWQNIPESLLFYVVDGDQSKFDEVYINSSPPDGRDPEEWKSLCGKLGALVYDEQGQVRPDCVESAKFPHELYTVGETPVILAGFYL